MVDEELGSTETKKGSERQKVIYSCRKGEGIKQSAIMAISFRLVYSR